MGKELGGGTNLGLREPNGHAGHAARTAHTSISRRGSPNRDFDGAEDVKNVVARSLAGKMRAVDQKHKVKTSA